MKIVLPALIASGLLFLLYRALCSWAQNDMRKAMYEEGQSSGYAVTESIQTDLPRFTRQDSTLQHNDSLRSPF